MATLARLIRTLEAQTDIPGPVIGRFAAKLAEAGHMPDADGDLLLEDAAALIVGLAAAAAATEVVDAVECYQRAPMVGSAVEVAIGASVETVPPSTLSASTIDFEAARESLINCLGMLIGQLPMRDSIGMPGGITVEIRRSTEAPFASVYIRTETGSVYRFVFAPPDARPPSPWQEWRQIDDALFVAVADLFADPPTRAAAALPASLH